MVRQRLGSIAITMKAKLPSQCASRKTLPEARIRDGRRILTADGVEEEVGRRDEENSPDSCLGGIGWDRTNCMTEGSPPWDPGWAEAVIFGM